MAMTVHPVTVNLAEPIYRRMQRAAERTQRSVEQLIGDALAAMTPEHAELPADLQTALAQMAYLDDAALWQAARTALQLDQQQRLAALHDQQQRTQLSPVEQAEEQALLKLYRETQLVRAQAEVLLMQRGYEVADPEQFAPVV
jgi:tryptophan 2,3-dioxygenase